jgi:hypothetical protein
MRVFSEYLSPQIFGSCASTNFAPTSQVRMNMLVILWYETDIYKGVEVYSDMILRDNVTWFKRLNDIKVKVFPVL